MSIVTAQKVHTTYGNVDDEVGEKEGATCDVEQWVRQQQPKNWGNVLKPEKKEMSS